MYCVLVVCVTCLLMILSIVFFPKIRICGHKIDTYWVVTSAGALVALLLRTESIPAVFTEIIADTAVNPVKILVLFISMTLMSVFLDEVGFFAFLASATIRKAKTSQYLLFLYLYLVVSVLTVFTSNDIIILTFTPFICFFAREAGISAVPYLFTEFIAANTWSMALIIGNPTNIYLATASGFGFADYASVMLLPTVAAGAVSFILLFLIFRKKLAAPIHYSHEQHSITSRPLAVIGVIHLGGCTLFLALSSYIGIDMWIVSFCFAVSLFIVVLLYSLMAKRKPRELGSCLRRAPWQLIPFVISMFILVLELRYNGVTSALSGFLDGPGLLFRYGFASFLASNVMNNIPMSVLFSSIVSHLEGIPRTQAVYASVIGSNIGAFLTPIGALAGMMWSSLLKSHGEKFGLRRFIRYGASVSVPTLFAALAVLSLIL